MIDTHVHTAMSADSEQDVDELVSHAIAQGLSYLAITDHQENESVRPDWTVDFAKERDIIARARAKYGNRIQIAYGIEMSYAPTELALSKAQIDAEPFDTVINSVHNINGIDCYQKGSCVGKTKAEAYGEYLSVVKQSLSVPYWYSQVGHIGYIARYGHYEDAALRYREWADELDEILRIIVDREVLLEVNTARSGVPAPDFDIVERYYALGGRLITLGSDAHAKSNLCENFAPTARRLSDIGFREIGYYYERKRKALPIHKFF